MKELPKTEHSLVLRTDFSDASAWDAVPAVIQEPNEDGYRAYVDCVSDTAFAGLTVEQLVAFASGGGRSFAFLVDQLALADPEHPILVVDLRAEPGRMFRVIPREMWSVENNLWLANMGFEEFADSVDTDGVFRGFPES